MLHEGRKKREKERKGLEKLLQVERVRGINTKCCTLNSFSETQIKSLEVDTLR